MRILFALPYFGIFEKNGNPFASSLVKGLEECGNELVCSLDVLWQDYHSFDLIFFQWPDALLQYVRNYGLKQLELLLDNIQADGIKTVITCHNLHPHNGDSVTNEIYKLLYSKVDAIHHLGAYSYNEMKNKYPDKFHFLCPHHVADNLFHNIFEREIARNNLKIPKHDTVVAAFGAFRNSDEENLFKMMAKNVGKDNVTFLAARMPPLGRFYNGRYIEKSFQFLRQYYTYNRLGIRCTGTFLTDEEQQMWLAATDIVFIQRKDILNSGNVPLAFAQAKIVVGPDLGNVGCILRETDNFLFNPDDDQSVKLAVNDAIRAHLNTDRGQMNLEFAKANWNTKIVSSQINRNLLSLLNGKMVNCQS